MLMRLRMLKLCVGKGRQVMKQLCLRYYAAVATESAEYVLYRALVNIDGGLHIQSHQLLPRVHVQGVK